MVMGIARVLVGLAIARVTTIPKGYRRWSTFLHATPSQTQYALSASEQKLWKPLADFESCLPVSVILALNTLWTVYGILSVTLRCIPFNQNWLNTKPSACVSSTITLAVTFGVGLSISCVLWVFAVLAARYVHMPSLTRLGLAFIFTLGFFDIIVGVVSAATTLTADRIDLTYTGAPPLIWQSLEATLAIVIISLVDCRALWDHALRVPPLPTPSSITGSSERRSGKKSGVSKDSYGRLKDADNGTELMPGSTTSAAGGRHENDLERSRSTFVKGSLPHNRARRDQMLSGGPSSFSTDNTRSTGGRDQGDLESGVFVRQDITVSAENRL